MNTTNKIKKANQENFDSHLQFLTSELFSAKRTVEAYKAGSVQYWQAVSSYRAIEKSIADYKAIFGI